MLISKQFTKFIEIQFNKSIQLWLDTWFDLSKVDVKCDIVKPANIEDINNFSLIISRRFENISSNFEFQWIQNAKQDCENYDFQISEEIGNKNYNGLYIEITTIYGQLYLYLIPSSQMVNKYLLQFPVARKSLKINKLIPCSLTDVFVNTKPSVISFEKLQTLKIGQILKSGHKIQNPLTINALNQKLSGFLGQQHGKKSLILESIMTDNKSQESNIEYQELEPDIQSSTSLVGVEQLKKSISVPISIELGKGEISLQSLSEIKPGEVINLHQSLDDLVILKANGVDVGKGVLTIEDGEFSIQLTEIVSLDS